MTDGLRAMPSSAPCAVVLTLMRRAGIDVVTRRRRRSSGQRPATKGGISMMRPKAAALVLALTAAVVCARAAEMPYPANPQPCDAADTAPGLHRADRLRAVPVPAGHHAADAAQRLRQRRLEAHQRRRPATRRSTAAPQELFGVKGASVDLRLADDHRPARRADRRARLRHPLGRTAARRWSTSSISTAASCPRRRAAHRDEPTTATATASSTSPTTWPTPRTPRTRASATRTATA